MNVDSFTLTGDLYGYENSSNTVLKSEYGVFLFAREGELEGFEGHIPPYMVDFLDGEKLLREDVEINGYCTEEHILVPIYEADNMEPSRTFVFEGEIAVTFGGVVEADPSVIGGDQEVKRFVEVYPTSIGGRHWTINHPDYVAREDIRAIFEESDVERVAVV